MKNRASLSGQIASCRWEQSPRPGSPGSKDSKLDSKRKNLVLVNGRYQKHEGSERKKRGLVGSQ